VFQKQKKIKEIEQFLGEKRKSTMSLLADLA